MQFASASPHISLGPWGKSTSAQPCCWTRSGHLINRTMSRIRSAVPQTFAASPINLGNNKHAELNQQKMDLNHISFSKKVGPAKKPGFWHLSKKNGTSKHDWLNQQTAAIWYMLSKTKWTCFRPKKLGFKPANIRDWTSPKKNDSDIV